jgi:hypothetical protein
VRRRIPAPNHQSRIENRQFAIRFIQIKRIAIALSCCFQKFQKFLTPFSIKTYTFFAPKKSRIFDTDMQVTGNYRGCFSAPERSIDIVLLKNLTKQEARHFEPLAGEKSVSITPAAGRPHFCLFPFPFSLISYKSSPQTYRSSPRTYKCSPSQNPIYLASSLSFPRKRESRLLIPFLTGLLSIFLTSVSSEFSVAEFKNGKTNPNFLALIMSFPRRRESRFFCWKLAAGSCFTRTNPIQKSLTYYTERTNPKIAKSERTQTNPILTRA